LNRSSVGINQSTFNPENISIVQVSETEVNHLSVSGKDILYKGSPILLKGTNIANIGALYAPNIGGIGSGDMQDIEAFESDYQKIRQQGANHVRFGLSFNWYTDNSESEFFSILDQHVAWAKQNGLWVVFNMFTTPGNCYEGYSETCSVFWNNSDKQNELADFWVKMAQHYATEPAVAGFDILNEPVGNEQVNWTEGWFNIAQNIIDDIRSVNSNKLIFVEAGPDATFTRKFNGANIVYSVHFYDPIAFTHNYDKDNRTYPGTFRIGWADKDVYYDKNSLLGNGDELANFKERYSYNWTISKNVPFYVGEWGTLSAGEGYVKYLQDVSEIFNELGISHAHYSWKAGNSWGLFNSGENPTVKEQAKLNAVKVSWQNSVFFDSNIPVEPEVPVEPDPVTPEEPEVPIDPAPENPVDPSGITCGEADSNLDGQFSIIDFASFAKKYGKSCLDNAQAKGSCGGTDANNDGVVNVIDFASFAKRYNRSSCST